MKQLTLDKCGIPIIESTFVVLDCETTGLSPNSDAITEIAAIKIKGGLELGTFHTLINPEQEMPRRIVELTGITNSDLESCPTFDQVAESFSEFIGNEIIVGHNVKFDLNFINASFNRIGLKPISNRSLDTLSLAKKVIPGEVPNYKLGTLASYCSAQTQPTHRAFADVKATIDLLHFLIERSTCLGVGGIEDLFSIPSKQKRSRFVKKSIASDAPSSPGVYIFLNSEGKPIYIGTSKNIKSRLRSYFTSDERYLISKMLKDADRIEYIETPSALEARIAEIRLLQVVKPRFNIADTKIPRQIFVYATLSEVAPTFRVSTKALENNNQHIKYGPFNSRKNASLFKDALNHAFGLRKCEFKCGTSVKPSKVECLNSLRGLHSCFCSGNFDGLEAYSTQFVDTLDLFKRDHLTFSNDLLSQMTSFSRLMQFENARQAYVYTKTIQKWMGRFLLLHEMSTFSLPESRDNPKIINGIAQVRYKVCEEYPTATKLCEEVEKGNSTLASRQDHIFCSPPAELRERYYLAVFLARKNLLNNEL